LITAITDGFNLIHGAKAFASDDALFGAPGSVNKWKPIEVGTICAGLNACIQVKYVRRVYRHDNLFQACITGPFAKSLMDNSTLPRHPAITQL